MPAFESGLSGASGTCVLPRFAHLATSQAVDARSGAEVFPRHLARSGIEGGATLAVSALDSVGPPAKASGIVRVPRQRSTGKMNSFVLCHETSVAKIALEVNRFPHSFRRHIVVGS